MCTFDQAKSLNPGRRLETGAEDWVSLCWVTLYSDSLLFSGSSRAPPKASERPPLSTLSINRGAKPTHTRHSHAFPDRPSPGATSPRAPLAPFPGSWDQPAGCLRMHHTNPSKLHPRSCCLCTGGLTSGSRCGGGEVGQIGGVFNIVKKICEDKCFVDRPEAPFIQSFEHICLGMHLHFALLCFFCLQCMPSLQPKTTPFLFAFPYFFGIYLQSLCIPPC